MVLNYGFFQSDPHNGNWFWEPETKTVTLIDWGGVGQLVPVPELFSCPEPPLAQTPTEFNGIQKI